MERFKLTPDLITGIKGIDAHHRTLFDMGNRVLEAASGKIVDDAVFGEALMFLDGYIIYHFAAEEHVMRGAGYPRYAAHRQWHERFRKEVSDLVALAQGKETSTALAARLAFMMEEWLIEHIRITDRDLAVFLQQKKDGALMLLPTVETLKMSGELPDDLDERFVQGFPSG